MRYQLTKMEQNRLGFLKDLKKISEKWGVSISACGCFGPWDEEPFKKIEYIMDPTSGDIGIKEIYYSDGSKMSDYD